MSCVSFHGHKNLPGSACFYFYRAVKKSAASPMRHSGPLREDQTTMSQFSRPGHDHALLMHDRPCAGFHFLRQFCVPKSIQNENAHMIP